MERLGNIVHAERRVVLTPEVHRERAEQNIFKITVHGVRVGVFHHCLVFQIIEDLIDACFLEQWQYMSERTLHRNVSFDMYLPDNPCFATNRKIVCV